MSSSAAILAAISNPRRRRILNLVWDSEQSAGDIARSFEVTWPAISQNLRVLRDSGLISERRQGTRRLYRANRDAVGSLQTFLQQMWEQDLDRLGELAAEEARGKQIRH